MAEVTTSIFTGCIGKNHNNSVATHRSSFPIRTKNYRTEDIDTLYRKTSSVWQDSVPKKSNTERSSSVEAYYSDPDLLINEYFASSSEQRAVSRGVVIQHVKSVTSVLEILNRGASRSTCDSYNGAAYLLAEMSNIELLQKSACYAIEGIYTGSRETSSSRLFAESFIEILIKAIACAYKIDARQRLVVLKRVLISANQKVGRLEVDPVSSSLNDLSAVWEKYFRIHQDLSVHILKTSIIDALVILSENSTENSAKKELRSFANDLDPYIRDYAIEALQDID